MNKIKIIVDGKIKSYQIDGSIINLTVMKHNDTNDAAAYSSFDASKHTKPLLADAKVGDLAETRYGAIIEIVKTDGAGSLESAIDHNKRVSYPIECSDSNSRTIAGKHCDMDNCRNDIIRLIPSGSAEWQEIKTAELLAKYPGIERDLSTVREGDTMLFSDGKTPEISNVYPDGDFRITPTIDGFGDFNCKTGKHIHAASAIKVTALGIIARKQIEYDREDAFDLLASGKAKSIRWKGWQATVPDVMMSEIGTYYHKHTLQNVCVGNYNKHNWIVVS